MYAISEGTSRKILAQNEGTLLLAVAQPMISVRLQFVAKLELVFNCSV